VRRKIPMVSQYVGIDLHRRRSVIVRQTPTGAVVDTVRIDNDPVALSCAITAAGPDPEVVIEATYGWVRHEALVRREALGIEGGVRPLRWAVAAAWWEAERSLIRETSGRAGSSADKAGTV
jgi:sensor domain CHASE-containing protein